MGAINTTGALVCLCMLGFCIIILNLGAIIITIKSRKGENYLATHVMVTCIKCFNCLLSHAVLWIKKV